MSFASYPSNLDLTKQSIEIPGTRKEGQTGVWKGARFDKVLLTAEAHLKALIRADIIATLQWLEPTF
nr:hypothetical protein L203_00471 [Cryptococcus depauperatus CBS 7841]